MRGTTPEGARTEQEAARWVRAMFGRIAPRYDLANHLLSGNLDRLWRRHTVKRVAPYPRPPRRARARHLLRHRRPRDRPPEARPRSRPRLRFLSSDAGGRPRRSPAASCSSPTRCRLPVRDASLDLITVAFGFRNLANYDAGLREMRRVLRPGGVAAILEFSQPRNGLFAACTGSTPAASSPGSAA